MTKDKKPIDIESLPAPHDGIGVNYSLPGLGGLNKPSRYRCPRKGCGQTWHQGFVGEKVPDCPDHKVQMVQAR